MSANMEKTSRNTTNITLVAPPNVIALPSRPSIADLKRIAMGRSRKEALPVLMARVRELYNQAEPVMRRIMIGGREMDVASRDAVIGNLWLLFQRVGDGFQDSIYFVICRSSMPVRRSSEGLVICTMTQNIPFTSCSGERLMSGHLYDDPKYPYHVMSWKRGEWQAELFN